MRPDLFAKLFVFYLTGRSNEVFHAPEFCDQLFRTHFADTPNVPGVLYPPRYTPQYRTVTRRNPRPKLGPTGPEKP